MKPRKQTALETRVNAAEIAANRPHPEHMSNGDELRFRRVYDTPKVEHEITNPAPSYIANFTKGLPHNTANGYILDPRDFQAFIRAIYLHAVPRRLWPRHQDRREP